MLEHSQPLPVALAVVSAHRARLVQAARQVAGQPERVRRGRPPHRQAVQEQVPPRARLFAVGKWSPHLQPQLDRRRVGRRRSSAPPTLMGLRQTDRRPSQAPSVSSTACRSRRVTLVAWSTSGSPRARKRSLRRVGSVPRHAQNLGKMPAIRRQRLRRPAKKCDVRWKRLAQTTAALSRAPVTLWLCADVEREIVPYAAKCSALAAGLAAGSGGCIRFTERRRVPNRGTFSQP